MVESDNPLLISYDENLFISRLASNRADISETLALF